MERLIAEAAFYGGAKDQTTGSAVTVNFTLYRVHTVSTTSAGLNIKLQSARQLKTGGVTGVVVNAGANSFNLVDNSNNLLLVMAAGDSAVLGLIDNTTAAGNWIVRAGTANFVEDPPANLNFYVVGGSPLGTYDHAQREYSPQLDTWTQKSDMPSPVTSITEGACGVYGTSGYWIGVTGAVSGDKNVPYQYDPDTWTAKTASAGAHAECAAAPVGTSVVAFNGAPAPAYATNEYSVGGDSWTSRTARPSPGRVTNPTIGIANSKAVLTDGTSNAVSTYTVDTWTLKTVRPGADARRCGTTSHANVCYVYGGAASGLFISSVYTYTEATDTWASLSNMSSGHEGNATCSVGSLNYVSGGKKGTAGTSSTSSSTATPETLEHDPALDTYIVKSDMSPVGTSPAAAYNVMNQGASITP